jgi:hypothetical protein
MMIWCALRPGAIIAMVRTVAARKVPQDGVAVAERDAPAQIPQEAAAVSPVFSVVPGPTAESGAHPASEALR